MDFYTDNYLKVTGNESDLVRFNNCFRIDGSPSSRSITFDKLYPFPERLLEDEERLDVR